jgi:RNA polymerase sigma factor (TIGR02999 family)
MRRILIDRARLYAYAKRGGGAHKVSLDETAIIADDHASDLLLLDEALNRLAEMDPRRSQVVELRYFGGLNNEEISGVLKISENTVTRDWNMARARLYQELSGSVT